MNLARESGENIGDALINDSDRVKIVLTPISLVMGAVIVILGVIITGY